MLNTIQLLPDSIANQIAAGEVVQRPASVVKELLENSVDAQAKSIQLVVRDAGRTLIQVIDDGLGMSETDARMSFERHATSKIRTSDDLFKIMTMGFRGEALASIAAVAQVEMRTRRNADELGTLIRIEGSEVKTQEPVSCLPGTNFLIKNLFFNVPARRNFLKSNSVEMRHILDEFQRIALAHSEVGFSLYHNDQEIYNLQAGKLSRRIVDMFGKSYREQLAYCEEETPYVKVRGYIGKPESAKKARGEQFFFTNNRFIKHNYLHHAVIGAYDGTLPDNSHPFYVLFIEIDPSHIDINIHPTKTEIKFDDERSVYAIVMAAVKKAVGVYNLSPSLDFDGDVNFLVDRRSTAARSADTSPKPMAPSWTSDQSGFAPGSGSEQSPLRKPSANNWQALFEGVAQSEPSTASRPVRFTDDANPAFTTDWLGRSDADGQPTVQSVTLGSRANQRPDGPAAEEVDGQTIIQVMNRYLVAPVRSGMLVIDQRGAYERILYDQFHSALTKRDGASQQLLFPKTVTVMPADYQLALDLRDELTSLGFQFDELGQHTFVIRGVPSLTMGENEEDLFANLLAQLREDTGRLKLDRPEALARSLAKRSAGKHLTPLSGSACKTLVDQVFASTSPGYTPGGELIMTVLTLDKIGGLFKS